MRPPFFSFFRSVKLVYPIMMLALLSLMPIQPVAAVGYDLSLDPKDISYTPSAPMTGDTVVITANITNTGDTATTVSVWFYLGTTALDSAPIPVVPTKASAKGDWDTTGLAPGTYKINITIVSSDDTNSSNNNASVTIVILKRPVAKLVIEALQLDPSFPMDGAKAFLNGTVRNDGDANATLDADFQVDNVSIGKTPLVLPSGQKKNVSMQWDTSGKEGKHEMALVLGTVRKTTQVTVGHRPQARFEVVRFRLNEAKPLEGRQVRVTAEVRNIGDAADEIVAVFKDNTKTYASSKPLVFEPGDQHNFTATWTAKKGQRVLRVEVEGYPDAANFVVVKPTAQSSNGCGYTTIAPGMAIVLGCFGVVKWKRGRSEGPGE